MAPSVLGIGCIGDQIGTKMSNSRKPASEEVSRISGCSSAVARPM